MIKFACMCLPICDILPNTKAGQNLEHQLSKSGTAPAVIYGEAQARRIPGRLYTYNEISVKRNKGIKS